MAEELPLVMMLCYRIFNTGLNCHTRKSSEDRINSFPQYTTEIEGLRIHFVALFSKRKDAVPLLLLHGWPGRSISWALILQQADSQPWDV